MKFFKLPDLGEGIPDAEIVQWHVREGETVHEDQVIVSMETAKAVVEVPSPCNGVVVRQFGQPGDLIHTGESLVEFEGDAEDAGTVVGSINAADTTDDDEEQFFVGASPSTARLQKVKPVVSRGSRHPLSSYELPEGEALRGVRREMLRSMARSGREVVLVTLFTDADIYSWDDGEDLSARVLHAVTVACQEEPALNAWFDEATEQRQLMDEIHIGVAVDSPHGLFVPVLHNAQNLPIEQLRSTLNILKEGVKHRELPPTAFQGATISVSNFGALGGGKYATPVVVPPAVAILGVGTVGDQVVPYRGQPAVHRVISLSLSFDHRAVTGGEASRFLKAVVQHLEQKEVKIQLQG